MTLEMFIMNIVLLVILTLLLSIGLKKVAQGKSGRVTKSFWNFLFPTYVLATVFTVLLLILGKTESFELLLLLQKYAMGAHVFACLLFMAALEWARTSAKTAQ